MTETKEEKPKTESQLLEEREEKKLHAFMALLDQMDLPEIVDYCHDQVEFIMNDWQDRLGKRTGPVFRNLRSAQELLSQASDRLRDAGEPPELGEEAVSA